MYYLLGDLKEKLKCDLLIINQFFSESPKDYLCRVQQSIRDAGSKYDRIVVLGGNHLSILPVYRWLYEYELLNIVTLDAHRDYYPEGSINHATFLKELGKKNTGKHYLVGARDFDKHAEKHSCIEEITIDALKNNKSLIDGGIGFLDIDLDVLDPNEFPWCGSTIDNGLTKEIVMSIIQYAVETHCKILAISEYIPNWDFSKTGQSTIIDFVSCFLSHK